LVGLASAAANSGKIIWQTLASWLAVRSKAAIAEFTELRWITLQTEPRHYPF